MSSHGSIFGSFLGWCNRRIDWFTGRVVPKLIQWSGAIYFFRVPALMFLLMMILFLLRRSSMASGLYGAAGTWRAFWLAFGLAIVAGQTFILASLLQLHGPDRLKMTLPPMLNYSNAGPRLLLSVVPAVLNWWALGDLNQGTWWYLAGGLALGLTVLGGIFVLTELDPGATRKTAIDSISRGLIRSIRRLDGDAIGFVKEKELTAELIRKRASDPNHPDLFELRENILLAALFFLVTFFVYLVFAFVSASAMFYVLLWLSLTGWLFGFLCLWLDRYRVPVFTVAAIWGILMTSLPWNSHYFFLPEPAAAKPPVVEPSQMFTTDPQQRDLQQSGGIGHIVIVSAEGGGIQAEAWTAEVLTGIADALPDRTQFLPAIRLMSGTSGGSAGIMFVQSLYESPRLNDHACREAVRFGARDGLGLDWTAYGIVYFDLLRPVIPELGGFEKRDRGFELEKAWLKTLQTMAPGPKSKTNLDCAAPSPENVTIDSLRTGVAAGTQPLLVFNATYADSGWPLVITNFHLAESSRNQLSRKVEYNGLRVFRERYGTDLPLTTAVRLSASFPYVLPSPRALACKPSQAACVGNRVGEGRELAVIDGGLYDNYGIGSAFEVLKQATASFSDYHKSRVLWIRILASPEAPADPNGDSYDGLAGTVAGPVLSLYEVRDTGQVKRAEELTNIALNSSNSTTRQLQILKVTYPFCSPPLSWALTAGQAHDIDKGWYLIRKGIVEEVSRFFDDQASKGAVDPPSHCQTPPSEQASR